MATVAKTPRTNSYTLASAGSGPFLIGFRLFDRDDLEVYVNGERSLDFVISSAFLDGYDDNASIAFNTPLDGGDRIQIDGALSPRREADYLNGDPGLSRKINVELARLWSSVSEIAMKLGRTVRTLDQTTPFEPEVDHTIIFTTDGFKAGPTANEIANAQQNADDAIQAASDAAASAARIDLGALDQAVIDSETARDKSREYAVSPEDVAVEPGEFSALHHAAKASAQRGLAETAKGWAEIAQSGAESARDAAALMAATSGAYRAATITAAIAQGVSALTVGDTFTAAADDVDYIGLYVIEAGPVAEEIAQYPTAGGVDQRIEEIGVKREVGSTAIFVIEDDNGDPVLSLDSDGNLRVAGLDGPLTDAHQIQENGGSYPFAIKDKNDVPYYAVDSMGRPDIAGIGPVLDRVASNDFITGQIYESFGDTSKSKFFLDKSLSSLSSPTSINQYIVGPDEDGGSFARMPSLVPIDDTTGIILFSQRAGHVSGGEKNQRVVSRSYSIDYDAGAVTTGATVVLDQPANWTSLGNADGYAAGVIGLRLPTGRIIAIYNRITDDNLNYDDAAYERANYQTYSDDDGATWSTPVKVMGAAEIYDVNAGGTGGIPGAVPSRNGVIVGTGDCFIRIPTGAYEGRLVFAIYSFNNYYGAFYSDDDGATWERGTINAPTVGYTYNESAIAYLADGSLVMLRRCDNNDGPGNPLTDLGVGRCISADGGETWSYTGHVDSAAFSNSSLSIVNASIAPETGFEKLIVGCSVDPIFYRRTDYRLRLSYDGGVTFSGDYAALFPAEQGVGYSSIKRLPSGSYALCYETFLSGGNINSGVGLGMAIFNEAALFASATAI